MFNSHASRRRHDASSKFSASFFYSCTHSLLSQHHSSSSTSKQRSKEARRLDDSLSEEALAFTISTIKLLAASSGPLQPQQPARELSGHISHSTAHSGLDPDHHLAFYSLGAAAVAVLPHNQIHRLESIDKGGRWPVYYQAPSF